MPTTPSVPRWRWPPLLQASVGVHAVAAGSLLLAPGSAPWAIGAVALNQALLTGCGLWPRSRWLGPNVSRLPAASIARREFALTFDDGPDPVTTPRLLDWLEAEGVRATFFCIAEQARRHPALVRDIVGRGHSVQNHSDHHRTTFAFSGARAFERELRAAQASLEDLTGRRPHCFRAPAGLRNPLLDPVLHRLDLHLVSWTRRGYDTRDAEATRVLARLSRGLGPGDILLLHDGHARRTAEGEPVLLALLPALLERARALGLAPVTLAEALPRRHAGG